MCKRQHKSAVGAGPDVPAAFAAGVGDFLSKPVDAAQLLARLRCGQRVISLEESCQQRIADLETALDEVRKLKCLLPICMDLVLNRDLPGDPVEPVAREDRKTG